MKRNVKLRFGGSVSLQSGKWALRLIPVLGLLFSASTLRAADNTGGVEFNSGVRYSQWAINSRLHDFYGNQKKFGFDYYDQKGTKTKGVTWYKLDGKTEVTRSFDYVAGLVGKATLEAADYYENFDWSKSWFYAAQGYATDTPYANDKMTLDNMNAAKMYLPILAGKLHSTEAENVANNAIANVVKHMKTYNTTYVIGSGKSALNNTNANDVQKKMFGGWFHKSTDYTDQMWCDGQYMGPALLAQIIKHNGKNNNISDNDWDIVAKQFNITWEQLYDSTTGLLYHGFTANPGDNASTAWAGISKEKGIYHSASFWGRANAWYFLALVDVLEAMPKDNTNYNTLKGYLTTLAAGIKNKQDKTTGCWYQVLDKTSTSLTGNYLEASCSSIFTAAYLKAIRLGLLDKTTYEPVAKKAYEGLVNQFMVYDNTDNNTIQLVKSCTSAGLGGSDKRAGDDNYYLTGKDAGVVTSATIGNTYYYTEGKVLGGFIMAATEYERAYQNQDSKQILFAKDLAPTYTINSSADVIDATAYGTDAEKATYQWYKDGKAVANATFATYSPTESGSYYCTATVGNNTIQTSTTTVTAKAATEGGDNNSGETTMGTVLFSASITENNATGGTITYGSTYKPNTSGYKLDGDFGNTKYVKVSLSGNTLNEGDTIKISTYSATRGKGGLIAYTGTTKGSASVSLGNMTQKDEIITYIVTASDCLKGLNTFYIYRKVKESTYVKAITITRPASETKTNLTAAYATTSVDAIVGEEGIKAPELTVTAGETPLENGTGYSVSYASDKENVVKVQEDGTLDAVGKGTAIITATITPTDGTKYNNTTLTFTINVSARPLKAVFSTNAVSANVGDEARVLPTLTVTDVNMQQQVSDYTTTYTSTNEEVATVVDGKLTFVGAGKTTIKVTVTPTDVNTFAPCEASFDVSVADKTTTDPTQSAVVYDFTTSVGNTESANANIKVNNGSIMFGTNFKANESKYLTITPNGDGGFKAGDVITLRGYCPKKNSGILIYADPTDAEPQFQSPAFADTEVKYTFTVQKDSPVLYLGRFGGSTTYVTYLNVTRPGTSGNKTRLTAAFAKNSDVIINKPDNYTIKLPELTVKAGNDEFGSDKYSVVYSSNDEQVATVADGNITIKTPGTVTILATVTPNDANSYEGCTATYTITVKNPTPLVISTMDVMMNATDAKVKQPVIKVYGDDDKLLTLNTDYKLSFVVKPATEGETANVSVDENGTFKVDGNDYNWTAGSSVITVTATPITGHNGDTYTEGTLDFLYNVVKGKLTPAFMNNFASEAIKIKKYDSKTNNNDKKFRVPLIYNGEDVSEYFDYTYTVVNNSNNTTVTNKNNKTRGNEFTFRPDTEGEFTIYVNAEPKTGKTDQDDYADVYKAPAPMQFNVIVSPDFIRPVITFNPESVQMYVGTTEGAPDVTVTDGSKKITNYNLKWVSFSPSYVKVDEKTGNLEAVSEGQGSVRITVTGDNLESMTAFLSVYVDDPAVYRTKSTENYGNQRKMWNQDGTMSVTLGGWMFPNNVTGTPYSDEGLSRDYYWADKATLPKWKMTGFDRFVSGEKNKNARQENGSNAMPNTTMVSTADFNGKGTVKDAMFNVPCSGSYLTFNPKTNGTVSVHIFQNGAFDSGVYRPQRRVFVMDEQGNFVQSTPEIENANGKPTGGLKSIGNYKWDINPKGKGTAPTIEEVRLHFKNIPTDFDMTAEKFQNNIYESNLSNDIVPNAAYNEKVPGSNGWCVLADSPVTYSFKVKAGKTYYLWNFGSKIGFYGYSFEEDATKPEVDDVIYDEAATDNKIESTKEGHVAKVSINRTFKAGVWSTCVLPFSLNMSQVDAIFGDTYRFGNENGTEILYFDRVDENGKVWFVRHAYNTIVANKPFLIKPTKDVNGINTADCAEYPYVIIEAPESGKPAAWCEGSGYSWVSGYNNNEMMVGNGDGFIAKDGSFMTYTGSDAPLKGFRGYLKKDSGAQAKILSVGVGSNVDSDNTTTLIDNLIIDNDANASYGISDGKVYNINGQVVGNGKSFNTLPSGVYIINGKKYIK